jgi:Zn-dependent metalloprotease
MRHCQFVPPFVLEALADRTDDSDLAGLVRSSLQTDAMLRAQRLQAAPPPVDSDVERPRRTVYTADNTGSLPGRRVRSEGDPPTGDAAADEAYDGVGSAWALFHDAYSRDSVDDAGHPLDATVHYERNYPNAFWDGRQLVFGDGDGRVFERFTKAPDVIAHEFTHGVTQHTAALAYSGQSGALNESVSDVFAALTVQRALGQSADEASWLIGEQIFAPGVAADGLRSMKAPGTAYDDPRIGKDPQPATMAGYVETSDDNGGVHINSGIPNHAFYLAATTIGGHAWEQAGTVWYTALTDPRLGEHADFARWAATTVAVADRLFGARSDVAAAVRDAWSAVGVEPADLDAPAPAPPAPAPSPPDGRGRGREVTV